MELEQNTFKTRKLTISGLVIALYVVIMMLTQSFAFGAVQVRIATALYSLSYVFPFLVLPLGVANIISNMLLGGLGVFDILGGFLVGVLTSGLIYLIKRYKLNLYLIIPVIILIPGLVVSIWLSYLLNVPYSALAFSLCLGQVIPSICGIFLIKGFKKFI